MSTYSQAAVGTGVEGAVGGNGTGAGAWAAAQARWSALILRINLIAMAITTRPPTPIIE